LANIKIYLIDQYVPQPVFSGATAYSIIARYMLSPVRPSHRCIIQKRLKIGLRN